MEIGLLAVAAFFAATGLFAWINSRFVGLPISMAMFAVGLLVAAAVATAELAAPPNALVETLKGFAAHFDFTGALLNFVLAFVLFAGGMGMDAGAFRRKWKSALTLASLGTLISIALVTILLWLAARWIGVKLPLAWALVFATLVSPTDPVAVLGIGEGKLPADVQAVLQGEALFNDGVGIVLFGATLAAAQSDTPVNVGAAALLVLREAGLGFLIGAGAGAVVIRLIQAIDDYIVEIMISLAAATGVFALADLAHASGPIAAALVGLIVGGERARHAMSETTSTYMREFWDVIDQLLNAFVFLLMGVETVLVQINLYIVALAICAALIALAARAAAIGVPGFVMSLLGAGVKLRAIPTLTWGGVRGAVTIALALAVTGPYQNVILACSYATVLFSTLLQAPTLGFLARRTGVAGQG